MIYCFFCGEAIPLLAMRYSVKWQQAKGRKWVPIGKACEGCGECRLTHITSQKRPLPEVPKVEA